MAGAESTYPAEDGLMRPKLVLRVDSKPRIGTGHVMRCLSLAQAWQDAGGDSLFVLATGLPVLEARLRSEGCEVLGLQVEPGSDTDALQTATLAHELHAAWLVVDGQHFGAAYQRAIKEAGLQLLAIDDGANPEHCYADVLLNQNLHADERLYTRREPYARLLLGPAYVLLRREFLRFPRSTRHIPVVATKILITLGGSDPQNMTQKVLSALQQVDPADLEAVVVVGAANLHVRSLEAEIGASSIPTRVVHNASNMPELMAWADVAVSSDGTTVWELAFMGVPSLVGAIAPVEELLLRGLEARGLFLLAGWFDQLTTERLAALLRTHLSDRDGRRHASALAQKLVDGHGCERTLKVMLPRS